MKTFRDFIINNDPDKKSIFVIVKPGFLSLSKIVISKIEDFGFDLIKTKPKRILLSEAKKLYKSHNKEDWYGDLCRYMASDISLGLLFKSNDSNNIEQIYDIIGDVKKDIRENYGESDMRNVIHSSDSYENMLKEQQIYFG